MNNTSSKGKEIKIPGPDHPITISPVEGKVRVTVVGRIVAESTRALRLEKKGYPPVYYLPRNDADMLLLVRTTHYTYCPYKGDCTYYSIPIGGTKWSTPCGPTKSLMRPSLTLRSMWRFIPPGLMPSKGFLKNVRSIYAGVNVMSNQLLLTPYRMGDLDLPNRIVMAPLTRMRAHPHDHVPTPLQAEYYAQRASAGLIIAEATAISPEGFGWADTPGLWTKEQVRGWRRVTDAVHAASGRIIAQLWHTGAISHPELLDGAQPVSASNVDPGQISVTPTGRKPTVTPRPLTKKEIQVTVADFARAARNAMEAGFDGVQILANYLYLISQFLNAATNLRTDEYGGSLENRTRILFEVVESVLGEVAAQRVGVKISPMHEGGAFQANDETLPITEYAVQKLSTYNLSHLLLMGNTTDFTGTPLQKLADDGMFRHFHPLYKGTLIANVKMDRDRGNRLIAEGLADLVAFGRPYIANPDLVQRFAENAPVAEVDWETVYASGPHGYSDYPTYQSSEHNPRS